MRNYFFAILLFTIQLSLFSQVCQQAVWAKSFGENSQFNGIVDGGRRTDSLFTICGSFGNSNLSLGTATITAQGFYHYFLGTHDTSGTFLNITVAAWYSLSGDILVVKKVHIGFDNSIYITGYWRGSSVHIADSLLPTATRNRMFVARFDANLQHVWTKFSDKTSADCQANGVASDTQKNVYVVGSFEDNVFKMGTLVASNYGGWNMWRDDAFLLKLDSMGNPQYVKNIGTPNDDGAFGVVADHNNDIYVFGHSGSSTSLVKFDNQIAVPGGVAGSSLFYGKYSGIDGNCIWGKLGGSHYPSGYLYVSDICMQDNNAILICGKIIGQANLHPYSHTTNDENGFVAKFYMNGDNAWLKTIGGQNSSETATRLSYHNGQIAVIGTLFSNQPYMGDFPIYSTLAGGSHKAFNGMMDTMGNTIWARTNKLVNSGSDNYYNGCALIDDDGNQIVWGTFKGTQTWYPTTLSNISSNSKLFAVRFAPFNGTPLCTVSAGPDKITTCGTSAKLDGVITPSTNVAYGWYPDLGFLPNGSKTPNVNPGKPTTYIFYATYQGCTLTDTVNVTYSNHDLSLSIQDSYSYCVGDSVQIITTCNQPTATFSWSPPVYINSSTSQNPFVKPPLTTQYVVTATNNGCIAMDTVTISPRAKPYIALPKQDLYYSYWRTHMCESDTIPIIFGDPLNTYYTTTPHLLHNMNNNTAYLLPVSGLLKIQAVNSFGCTASDSISVIVHNTQNAPLVQGSVIDREKCPGDTAYFNIQFNNAYIYNFQYGWYAGWQVDSLDGEGWRDINTYDRDFEISNSSVGYPSSIYYSKLKLNLINQNMNGFKYRPYIHDYCSPRGFGNEGLIIVGAPITTQPNSITLCQGETDSISVTTSESTALFYWEILQNGIYLPLTEQPGILELNGRFLRIVNATSTIDSTWVRCKIMGCSGTSQVYSQSALIRVIQGAQIVSQPLATPVCDGDTTVIQFGVASPELYTFRWYQNDVMLVTNTSQLSGISTNTLHFTPISALQNGIQYTCEILNTQCNVGVFTLPVTMRVDTIPEVHLSGLNNFYCVYHPSSTLVGIPEGGSFSGNGVTDNQFSPSIAGIGSWPIVYFFSDNNPCFSTDTVWVEVDGCDGVDLQDNFHVKLFPNPTFEILYIPNDIDQRIAYQVFDIYGKLAQAGFTENNSFNINALKAGVYIVYLQILDKKYISKVIKL